MQICLWSPLHIRPGEEEMGCKVVLLLNVWKVCIQTCIRVVPVYSAPTGSKGLSFSDPQLALLSFTFLYSWNSSIVFLLRVKL